MIGFLSGILKSIRGHQAIILANGVGYSVALPTNVNFMPGNEVELFIHTHVREDALTLFGFKEEASLDLFEKLISVSGVGPKSALAIISAGSADVIKKAIEASNINFFTAISGIGKKGAQKIIIELKPKLSSGDADLSNLEGNSELNQALGSLGFTKTEILAILPNVDVASDLSVQIKQALKLLRS
jgi:Holliday junction DNA helicase RuvA